MQRKTLMDVNPEKKQFVGKYESIFDHDVTPEEFKQITGFTNRDEYLRSIVFSKYAGCPDIFHLYALRGNNEEAKRYSALAEKAPFLYDECLPYL